MSSRILKKEAADGISSFRFPNVGASSHAHGAMQSFVFPEIGRAGAAAAPDSKEFSGNQNLTPQTIEDVIQTARAEAAQIIALAEQQSAAIQQAAEERALIEARRTIEEEIAARIAGEAAELRQSLTRTIGEINGFARQIAAEAEKELVEFALEIAKKIVGREVSIDREVVLTLVKISLAKLHNRTFAKIHLNPDDFAFIEAHRERLSYQGSLEIVSDRSISPGGCLVHTETGEIDARIESQFDEIAHGLLSK